MCAKDSSTTVWTDLPVAPLPAVVNPNRVSGGSVFEKTPANFRCVAGAIFLFICKCFKVDLGPMEQIHEQFIAKMLNVLCVLCRFPIPSRLCILRLHPSRVLTTYECVENGLCAQEVAHVFDAVFVLHAEPWKTRTPTGVNTCSTSCTRLWHNKRCLEPGRLKNMQFASMRTLRGSFCPSWPEWNQV